MNAIMADQPMNFTQEIPVGVGNHSVVTSSFDMDNDNITNGSVASGPQQTIISDQVQYYIDFCIAIPLCSIVSSFGIIANILNIIVFLKQDLKSSVSTNMFSLAWSDLGMCLATFTATVSYAVYAHEGHGNFGHMSPNYQSGAWVRGMFYSISSWVTLFASIERCLCVVLPFKIKVIISRGRTAVVLILIYVVSFLIFLPAFIAMGIYRFLPPTQGRNESEAVAWFRKWGPVLQDTASTFTGIFTPTVTQVLIIITTYVMTRSLRYSVKFRNKTTVPVHSSGSNGSQKKEMTSKDRTLMKMVTVISVIFISCNLPVMVFVYGRRLVPGLDFNGHLKNLHATFLWVAFLCGAINSSVNIFVYYRVSSLFRSKFRVLFGRSGGRTQINDSIRPSGSDDSSRGQKY